MGTSIKYFDPNVYSANSIWVDARYGDDATGEVDNISKPFLTIDAAWAAVGSTAGVRNNCIFRIAPGNYTLTTTLSDSTWGTTPREITFKCEGVPAQTVISSAVVGPMITITSTSQKKQLNIQGGTWIRTGITGNIMFNVSSSDNNEMFIRGANITDQGGTAGIGYQRTTELIEDCIITCTNNAYVFAGSGANTSTFKMKDTTVTALTSSSFFSSNTLRPFKFDNCLIDIPSGIIGTANGNVSCTFKDTIVNHSGVALDGRALNLLAQNTKFKSITNNTQIIFDSQTGLCNLRADGLYLERPDTATSSCIGRSGRGMVKAYIYGRGLYYSERTPPASGSNPATTDSGPNGRVGFVMGSATIGNVITINLPGTMASGTPYNTAPIIYNVASTTIATELAAMKALIDAQVLIPGTPWNIFCQGDTSLVRTTATQMRIIMHPLAPGFVYFSTTTNYTSDTLGDVINDSNLLPDGIVDLVGGPQYPLVDIPRINGSTDYPEVLVTPVLTLRTV